MTINTTQLRSFVGPVWQEISSLWSGVDFSFSDGLPDSSERLEQTLLARATAGDADSGIHSGRSEPCW
jgi:hypothetical protein